MTIKPYDFFTRNEFFERTGDKYLVRTNPAWADPEGAKTVRSLRLVREGDGPLGFDPKTVKISTSMDNRNYAAAEGWRVTERVETLANGYWTPSGKVTTPGGRPVRVLEFTGLPGPCNFVELEFPQGGWKFGNVLHELVRCDTDRGTVRGAFTTRRGGKGRPERYMFEGVNNPAWSDETEAIDRPFVFGGGARLGVALTAPTTRTWMFEACFPEVRKYWCDYFVKRAIAMGADGVDVRAANHKDAPSWLAFSYAEPVLAAFRSRFGREPDGRSAADLERIRRLRGEGFTQFLREAGALLRASGRKLEAHVEATMKSSPAYAGYQGIHFDWHTWLDEKLIDGVNLKYLGPFNRFVRGELMPLARKTKTPVHQIAAIGDPRTHWRTADEAVSAMELCRLGGVEALNLYETLVYLRTYPTGENQIRGCALQALKALAPLARRPAVPMAEPPLAVSFAEGGWRTADWVTPHDPRWDYPSVFEQRADHIVNLCPAVSDEELFAKHNQRVYAAQLYGKAFAWGGAVSATLSFDHRMAPGLLVVGELGIIADGQPVLGSGELGRAADGQPVLGSGELGKSADGCPALGDEWWEVIAYDEGLNVWHHYLNADGRPVCELTASSRGALKPKTRYELKFAVPPANFQCYAPCAA